jgi:hypothetical protein
LSLHREMPASDEAYTSVVEQLDYCERMVLAEARLDLVVVILEELIEKLSNPTPDLGEATRQSLLQRAKLIYHRAKTLLYMAETTRGARY